MSRRNRRRISRRSRARRKGESDKLKQAQSELLACIGETLLHIQAAERQLQFCLSYFFPDEKCNTVAEIEAQAKAERKKPLGELLKLMRKRMPVNPLFDKQLEDFVEHRNALAHRFLQVEGVSLTGIDGIRNAAKFLEELRAQAIYVRKTLKGLMTAILGEDPHSEEDDEYAKLAMLIFFPDDQRRTISQPSIPPSAPRPAP